jgi:CheY-like chemotaxis protein
VNVARILLVEDDRDNRVLMTTLLGMLGHEVEEAVDGAAGLAAALAGGHDAVLMDLQLPEMDGLEATRRLRAAGRTDLPVVAVTAHAMLGDRETCLAAGMDRYLAKPLTLALLRQALADVGVDSRPSAGSSA